MCINSATPNNDGSEDVSFILSGAGVVFLAMDELLPQLLAFPPHPPPPQPMLDNEYDRQIRALVALLNSTSASKLVGGVSGGGDLLDILDPSINTLPYLYTLLAHVSITQNSKSPSTSSPKAFSPSSSLWLRMLEFMERFDPVQVRYVGYEWRRLVELVIRVVETASQPEIAIEPVKLAILRLDPSSSCFTSTHLLFFRLCLLARSFQPSIEVLDRDIFHFPATSDKNSSLPLPCSRHETSSTYITANSGLSEKLNYKDHLRYFLYGAMLYLGVKKWERALLYLEIVIMSPTHNTASMIQVEAYKKWVLVGLLLEGRPILMPRTTNPLAAKLYRAIAKPYDAVAEVFKEGNMQKLHAEVVAGQQVWQDDFNTGLVLQVYDAFRRFSILNLQKTFTALSIPEIAKRTSPPPIDIPETENYIISLIDMGQLNATITQSSDPSKPSILRFASSSTAGPLGRSEAQQYEELVKQTTQTKKLAKHIKETDRKLELSSAYLEWARKGRRAKDAGEGGGGHLASEMMQIVNEGYGVDEDMLADM